MMRLAELCAGYGGIGLALDLAGVEVQLAWWSEIDPHASTVMAAHTDAPNVGDLTTVDWRAVEPVDVLAAGFPCQPLSTAGRREGLNDERWIWPDIAHAVRVLRPRWVVLENVTPILRPWRDPDGWWRPAPIEAVAAELAQAGYVGRWCCLRASDVGAPHRRERWFCVAYTDRPAQQPGHTQPPDSQTPAPRRGPTEPRRRAGSAANTHSEQVEPLRQQRRPLPAAPAPDADGRAARWDAGALPAAPDRARRPGGVLAAVEHGGRAPAADTGRQRCDRPPASPGDGSQRWDDASGRRDQFGPYAQAVARWERVLGRPAPAPTDDRGRLSPLLVEWMMGLPEGWVTGCGLPRTAQLRVLGNGIVPHQAAAAIRELAA